MINSPASVALMIKYKNYHAKYVQVVDLFMVHILWYSFHKTLYKRKLII